MKNYVKRLILLASIAPLVAQADPITISFEQSGFGGGTVSGIFTGEDTGDDLGFPPPDGFLFYDTGFGEISDFSLAFELGGSVLFTLGIDDLIGLIYEIDTGALEISALFESDFVVAAYDAVPGEGLVFFDDGEILIQELSEDPLTTEVVSVPEPGTLALISIGLLSMGAARRRRTG